MWFTHVCSWITYIFFKKFNRSRNRLSRSQTLFAKLFLAPASAAPRFDFQTANTNTSHTPCSGFNLGNGPQLKGQI